MECLDELRLLNYDITRFFISLSKLHSSPLFAQLLDLPSSLATNPGDMDNSANDNQFCTNGDDARGNTNLFSNLDSNNNNNSSINTPNANASSSNNGNLGSYNSNLYPLYTCNNNASIGDAVGANSATTAHFRECILNSVK